MISRPDFRPLGLSAATLLLVLAGCSDQPADVSPFDQAQQALVRGDGLAAEVALREMIAAGTPNRDIAAFMGHAELMQGQPAEARKWLAEGAFSAETSGYGYHMLGRLEMIEENLPAAGKAFDRALQKMPDDAELWVDIGRLRYAGGEQVQAVEASERALELGPKNPLALQFRAQLIRDAEGMAAALPWYEAALEYNPDNLALLGDYAATLGEAGRAKDMLTVVRKMVKLDDRNPQAYYLQAVLAARTGKFDVARTMLARSGEFERDVPAAMLLSAIIDMEYRNFASASQTLDRLATMQPDNRRVQLLLARSLSLGGNHRELIYRFEQRAALPSASPYLETLVGRAYEVLDERAKAAPFLDMAAIPSPERLVAIGSSTSLDVAQIRGTQSGQDALALVRELIVSGRHGAAIANAEAFLKRFPGSADALSLSGDAYLAAGQGAKALTAYRKSAAIRRTWPLTRRIVAAHAVLGQDKEGLQALEEHLRGDPANVEAAILLAKIALGTGDIERADILLDHAIANGADRNPEVLALAAQVARQLDDFDFAEVAASRAYELQRMNRLATMTLADVLAEFEGDEESVAALRAKAAKLPTNR